MLAVPLVAVRLTAIFIVDVPLPAIDEGLKEMVVPLLCPVADSAIEEMLPCVTEVVIVEFFDVPLVMLSVVGLAAMVKLEGAAVTVRLTVVV